MDNFTNGELISKYLELYSKLYPKNKVPVASYHIEGKNLWFFIKQSDNVETLRRGEFLTLIEKMQNELAQN